ncbi:hypothetical protein Dimus_027895 [Dionaea muscipula]
MNRRFLTWLLLVFVFITLLLQTFDNSVPQQDEMKRGIDDVGINEIRRRRKEVDAVQLIHGRELAEISTESTDPDRNEIRFHSRKGGHGKGGGGRGSNMAHHHNSPPRKNQANAVFSLFSYPCSLAAITITLLLFI